VAWCHSPNHPDLATPAGEARSTRYHVDNTWPAAFFDGPNRAPLPVDSFYPIYDSMVRRARSQTTVLELSLDPATTHLDSTELSIGVHIAPTDRAVDSMAGLMLVAVVYEDSAPYVYVSGYTHYIRFCAREVIGGTWGIPLTIKLGADYDTVLTTPLGAWDRSRLGVAVFVQDTSNLIVIQSVTKRRFMD
jgi:hypothetical protein